MHRFLGYDLRNMTHNYVSFTLDFVLLVVLLVVWKPVALLLIYLELLVRAVLLAVTSLLQGLWDVSPMAAVRTAVMRPYYMVMGFLAGSGFMQGAAEEAWRKRKGQTHRELVECLLCIGSLSLLLRFVSGGPSSTELRKHDKLNKISVLYRVFRHII